ncbi:MAG: hypothetical protein JWP97_288 [Labilithrix sp.]|nr:hypothetical protein [Labilithrix sp.]
MSVKYRPIARSFKARYLKEAIAHAKAGGHSFVWETDKRAVLMFVTPAADDAENFGAWAVYDMGKSSWHEHTRGQFKGLSTTLVPRDCGWIAKRRTERDSIHPGPTRAIDLDCTTCAACCRDNEVILSEADLQRFRDGGRPDLAKPPYAKRQRDGRTLLTLLENKRCRHLKRDNKCGIYELRPHPCSEFPSGSECCLFAREDVLGLYDGVKPSPALS